MTKNNDTIQQLETKGFIFSAEFTLQMDDPKQLQAAYKAIQPETMVEISTRGRTEIQLLDHQTLKMTFLAKDFTTLRAMVSSYLRWIDVVTRSIATVKIA
ncbi:MAG: hypothetical protein GF308_17600 [Candidatus Heimdallarchaeota archaeon]|nr:hypothetical protein [Candidatus Heimdallarchaeota archaeon]